MLVRLWLGVLDSNWLCGGASTDGSNSLSNMLDLACHRAFVTGEWYMPGHRLRGLRRDDPASIGGDSSNGEVSVETTEIVLSLDSLAAIDECPEESGEAQYELCGIVKGIEYCGGGRTEPTREMAARHALIMTLAFVPVVGFCEMPAYLILVPVHGGVRTNKWSVLN